jgi:CheY-like chemotaxis protein
MDGFEMVRRYRALENALPAAAALQPRRAPMAIVGMSANSDLASQSLAVDAGMNAFMPKPFSAADMQAVLDLFLSR